MLGGGRVGGVLTLTDFEISFECPGICIPSSCSCLALRVGVIVFGFATPCFAVPRIGWCAALVDPSLHFVKPGLCKGLTGVRAGAIASESYARLLVKGPQLG